MTAWTRREFIGTTGAVALAATLVGCASDAPRDAASGSAAAVVTPAPNDKPADTAEEPTAPATTNASATIATPSTAATTTVGAGGSIKDIEHVVIFFQENRSFDHYFGTRKGVRGFADPAVGNQIDPTASILYQPDPSRPDGFLLPYHMDMATTSGACGPDPDHSWGGQHRAWNSGKNDGFATTMGASSMGYFSRADLPYYSALADEFTLCDHYFSSVLGPTTPNRLYSMSATIDAAATAGGPVIDNLTGPFNWMTYPEQLQNAGVTWRVYHEADDYDDNPLKFFANFQNLASTDPLFEAAIKNRSADAFIQDALAGDLPQVSWIVAPTVISEHPPFPIALGEDMSARVLAALMGNAELWATTVFILSYDENGGFFDHVAPPTPPAGTPGEYVGDQPIGLGFRVPTTVISPWSRGGRVSSEVLDHTSTLMFLEQRFGVEIANLSEWRRATCGDLTSAFDFSSFDASVPTFPATAARAATAIAECASKPPAEVPTVQRLPTVET